MVVWKGRPRTPQAGVCGVAGVGAPWAGPEDCGSEGCAIPQRFELALVLGSWETIREPCQ